LLQHALSIKASFSLLEDQFVHSAHLCIRIRCLCWRDISLSDSHSEGVVTFIDCGSCALPALHLHDAGEVPSINYSAVSVQRALPTSHRLAVAYLCNSTLTYLLTESFDECCRSVWLGCLGPAILDANDTASTLSALYNVRSMTTRNGWRHRRSFHGLGDSNFYGNIEFATRQPSTTHTQARRESSSTRTLAK
jgi:hypothetical protein